MKKGIFLCAFTLLLFVNFSYSQKAPIKFGKIAKEELEMTTYDQDTATEAVILCDFGTTTFRYSNDYGFNVVHKRITRIKILKKEGYKWAKKEILLSKKYDDLTQIKAVSLNLVDGKIEKTKLENKDRYNEDFNKYWDKEKFEMPNVKVGTVIDIQYTVESNSWHLKDWFFQDEIPTKLSRLDVYIPEYFNYKKLQKGYLFLNLSEVETLASSFDYKYENPKYGGLANEPKYYHGTVEYQTEKQIFKCENIPAFKKEAYMTCMNDYRSSIQFELKDYKFKYSPVKNVTATWKGICTNLLNESDFGLQIKKGGFLKNDIENIISKYSSDEEKISALYHLIQSEMHWNGYRGIYSKSIAKAWENKDGNCGDINLMLVAGLKKMGYDANPVILSTRNNGKIHPAQVILNQYNYVVAGVKINEKIILLDATNKNLPAGTLPKRCLNEKGRLIAQGGGEWVKLNPAGKYGTTYQAELTFNNEGIVEGSMREIHKDYAAINIREELKQYSNDEDYIKEYQNELIETEIELDSITDAKNLSNPVKLFYQFESENNMEMAGDLILLNPYILGNKTSNPFKLEKRDYPVDYSYPIATTYMATITIPEGFSVTQLPKPSRVGLPEKSGSFIYSVSQTGNKLVVVSRFNINKVLFLAEEYDYLKEFYNMVINTQSQQIELKKL